MNTVVVSQLAWLKRRLQWRARANVENVSIQDTQNPVIALNDSEDSSDNDDDESTDAQNPTIKRTLRRNTNKLLAALKDPNTGKTKVLKKVIKFLLEGANPNVADDNQDSALHHAVGREWVSVCVTLLDAGADPTTANADGLMPLHVAFYKVKNDVISAMLVAYMPPSKVRDLYIAGPDHDKADFNFQQLIQEGWTKTSWSVLDCIIDPQLTLEGTQLVYYGILESDSSGRAPDHGRFDTDASSLFQLMCDVEGADIFMEHDAMKLLIHKTWDGEIKSIYLVHAVLYLLSVLCLSYASVVASSVENPAVYTGPLDYSRAATEVIAYSVVLIRLYLEVRQIANRGCKYFTDQYSVNDLSAVTVLLLVIPLRFTHQEAQWFFLALGYTLWYIRLFHYVAIVPTFGIYVSIIWQVFKNDLMPFVLVFVLLVLGFSGAQLLANRFDVTMEWATIGTNGSFPRSNASYVGILSTLGKTLFDVQDTADYTGSNGHAYLGTILMFAYLFVCLVLFVNMLIAQITTTFTEKSSNALREHYFNMLWMITRVKLASPLFHCVIAAKKNKCCSYRMGQERQYLACEYVDIAKTIGSRATVGAACDERRRQQQLQDTMAQLEARMSSLETSVERLVQIQLGIIR